MSEIPSSGGSSDESSSATTSAVSAWRRSHLIRVGRRHQRSHELLPVRGRGGRRESLDDGRKLERCQVHSARVKQEWCRDAYPVGFVSTLELIWQHGSPYAIARSDDGVLTDDGLTVGSRTEIHVAGSHAVARRLSVADLTELETALPLGATAHAVLALRDLARRTVADGLVHPQLTRGGTSWYAFWGATLDDGLQAELDAIVGAAPAAAGELDELYPQLVDQVARDRLHAADVSLTGPAQLGRSPALEAVLRALGRTRARPARRPDAT